jgi:two-component system, NarL family, sensor histidine kinase DesK
MLQLRQNAAKYTGSANRTGDDMCGESLMPGLIARAGWLSTSTTPAPQIADTQAPPDTLAGTPAPPDTLAEPPPAALGAGPKLARAVLLAVLCSFVAVQAIDELTAPFASRGTSLAIGFTSLGILFVLTVLITSPQAEHWPLRVRLAMLLCAGLVTYLPLLALFSEWAGMAGFFAGASLLLLSGWQAWTVFVAVVVSMAALPLATGLGPYLTAYLTLSTLAIGLVVSGLTRLAVLIKYVHATRGELAQLAVMNERVRFARDLHDLLGFSLSAITLKAELIRRMVGTNPARARDELADLLDIARQALADTRLVASGYRNISLAKEASSVAALLNAAGINVTIEINCGPLEETVDTVLATVLREAVTNMLRHSVAQNCSIEAGQVDDIVRLRMVNDGVPRTPVSDGHPGGLKNLGTRLEAVGGRIDVKVVDGQFHLQAEAPYPKVTGEGAEA